MCLIDNSDGTVTPLHEERRKARKDHACRECRRVIGKGETYLHEAFIWEGKKKTHKTCAHCLQVRAWLHDNCDGWVYSGLYEDMMEHASYSRLAARLCVGMRRYWTTIKGQLMKLEKAA